MLDDAPRPRLPGQSATAGLGQWHGLEPRSFQSQATISPAFTPGLCKAFFAARKMTEKMECAHPCLLAGIRRGYM